MTPCSMSMLLSLDARKDSQRIDDWKELLRVGFELGSNAWLLFYSFFHDPVFAGEEHGFCNHHNPGTNPARKERK